MRIPRAKDLINKRRRLPESQNKNIPDLIVTDLDIDRQKLERVKETERKKKLLKVNILRGYVLTTNPAKWIEYNKLNQIKKHYGDE